MSRAFSYAQDAPALKYESWDACVECGSRSGGASATPPEFVLVYYAVVNQSHAAPQWALFSGMSRRNRGEDVFADVVPVESAKKVYDIVMRVGVSII